MITIFKINAIRNFIPADYFANLPGGVLAASGEFQTIPITHIKMVQEWIHNYTNGNSAKVRAIKLPLSDIYTFIVNNGINSSKVKGFDLFVYMGKYDTTDTYTGIYKWNFEPGYQNIVHNQMTSILQIKNRPLSAGSDTSAIFNLGNACPNNCPTYENLFVLNKPL